MSFHAQGMLKQRYGKVLAESHSGRKIAWQGVFLGLTARYIRGMRRNSIRKSASGVIAGLALLISACSGPQRPDHLRTLPPKVTDVEVYEAEDWRVEVAKLEDGKTALLRLTGADSEIDGIPLLHEYESDDYGRRWVTQIRGRERSMLYGVRSARAGGEAPYRIHPPNARDARFAERLDEVPSELGDAIARRYAQLLDEGVIEKLQRYDRHYEIEREKEQLSESLLVTRTRCDLPELEIGVDWETVGDQTLLTQSISGRCDSALTALRQVCEREGAKEWLRSKIESVECSLDEEAVEPQVALDEGTLRFRFALESVNLDQKAREGIEGLEDERFGNFEAVMSFHSTRVCQDESGERFTVISPLADPEDQLAYGTEETLYRVPHYPGIGLGWFLDPRSFNPKHSDAFRGYDLRYFSKIEVDGEQCRLSCGEREILLSLADDETKEKLLSMEREPSPFDRVPHALARDKAGVYYYVDRGNTPETAKDFRLYRGQRGALRQLEMRDVVSDSEGEIFESRSGTLRLVLDRDEAAWLQGKSRKDLKALPIEENLGVIFNELGVYLGRPLGVPCDDL